MQSSKIISYVLVILSNSKIQWYYSHYSGLRPTTNYPDSVTADQYSLWLLYNVAQNNTSSESVYVSSLFCGLKT